MWTCAGGVSFRVATALCDEREASYGPVMADPLIDYARRSRRHRRMTAIVGIAAGIGVACGGAALVLDGRPADAPAVVRAAGPAAASEPGASPADAPEDVEVPVDTPGNAGTPVNSPGTVEIAEKGPDVALRVIDVSGLSLAEAKRQLADVGGVRVGKVVALPNCTTPADTVASVYPHSPRSVPMGGTINLMVCE